MQIDTTRFHAAFFEEATEHLATIEECLLGLERAPDDSEMMNRLFRAAHSVKGASGTFGFHDIADFTHGMESLLDRMRDGRVKATPELIKLLLSSSDALTTLVEVAKNGGESPTDLAQLAEALETASKCGGNEAAPIATVQNPATQASAVDREYSVEFQPGKDIFHNGMDPLLLIRDLSKIGRILEISADTSQIPELELLAPDECYLRWNIRLATDLGQDEIQSVFVFVEDYCKIAILPASKQCDANPSQIGNSSATPDRTSASSPQASAAVSPKFRSSDTTSIRVSVEKVDELINLVGELVIAQSMVNQALGQIPTSSLPAMQEALAIMDRSTRDLQERVMSVRMIPLASVFRRFPRLVRDLAASMNKQIDVVISGEDTELDKQMIEQIADPLTHLIRNAVDHGIESAEQRKASGKPTAGKVGLHAYHEGGSVVIEVSDDGNGLDCRRIREKAVTLGLIDTNASLDEDQINALIFAPGFSTAEKVSDVSGRGVGMDVVKRNIEALNGSVGIESTPGAGSIFRIRLPLTMAILDGLAASLNDDIYIFPLLSVVESFRPNAADVKTVSGKGEVIVVRGKPVPLVRLHRIFNCPSAVTDPSRGLVVIAENQGKQFCVLVDDLLGQKQIVMKSIEANYQKIEGISAATILGDGEVAFVLDVPGLSRLAKRKNQVCLVSS
jgi:two-component system chemotaxis sensor kinase CheA